jgi:alpha-beta hydrolase superfamily lysophospholipase
MPQVLAPDGSALVFDAYDLPSARAAMLVLPGWADHAGRYAAFAERLRAAGIATYAIDLRGHGRSAGHRAHLTRFSQLLGDLQAFRRAVRQHTPVPQVLFGHGFGALVVLRYLETQPPDPPGGAVIGSPFLGPADAMPTWKLLLTRACADLWPTVAFAFDRDADHWSRDPAVNAAYAADPLIEERFTAGALRETQWAQRAVAADGGRIECPLLFLLAGEDRMCDAHLARAFADGLKGDVDVQWHAEMYHEVLSDPQRERVIEDILAFLAQRGLAERGTRG